MSLIDNLLDYLRGDTKKTAVVAKERLQIILAHERAGRNASCNANRNASCLAKCGSK